MKTNASKSGLRSRNSQGPVMSVLSFALGLAVAGMSMAVNAATTFPDYPLQTNSGWVPPNIVLILDDSGSMTSTVMYTGLSAFGDANINFYNSLAYDPARKYEPWLDANGNRLAGGTSIGAAYSDNTHASPSGFTTDLKGKATSYFYMLKPGFVPESMNYSQRSDRRNYYRFRIDSFGRWVRSEELIYSGNSWSHNLQYIDPPGVPDQLTNYATWYSYHRTRMKAAKAGASLAFSRLDGEKYRVGYDRINNGGQYSNIVMPIPVARDGGLFRGQNRIDWFNRLHNEGAPGWTPLRSALYRTGYYYQNNSAPWTVNGSGTEYSCRRSYAILTTDGEWNGGTPSGIGNEDGTASANYMPSRPFMDREAGTLADVAMHFWKNDLRPNVANDVVAQPNNPATWQHMTTFSISIGLQGSMPPTAATLAQITNGTQNWPSPTSSNKAKIDDLWHAAVNGRGEFVVASDAESFADALTNALDAIAAQNGSGGGVADNNGRTIKAGSQIYTTNYQSGTWYGDLRASALSTTDVGGAPIWSLAANSLNPAMNFAGRAVYTWNQASAAGGGVPLTLTALGSKAALLQARAGSPTEVSAVDNLAYIRGDRSKEMAMGGNLRNRQSGLIGDIVNSTATYVADAGAVFVGANDGMLHAVAASSGMPLFSYMPKGIDYTALADISNKNYSHRFFVDGDMWVSSKQVTNNRNILVSPLGRGGKGMFALDVTNPAGFDASNVLWDETAAEGDAVDPDVGYILSRPLVLKGNNGRSLVIAANGVESASGSAKMLIYELDANGAIVGRRKLGQTVGLDNGMMDFTVVDADLNGTADIIYGGDLQGNVWKIDISSPNATTWKVAGNAPMFVARDAAGNRQPITGGFVVAREPQTGKLFVSFGTGKFLSENDKAPGATQTLYALIDDGVAIAGRGQLQQRSFTGMGMVAGQVGRSLPQFSELPNSVRGWYLDLGYPQTGADNNRGERITTRPEVYGRMLAVTTMVPMVATGCSSDIKGAVIALDAFTGTLPRGGGYLDMNNDGNPDMVNAQGVGSVSFSHGVGKANIFVDEAGNAKLVVPALNGAPPYVISTIAEKSGGARVNWRELIRNN